MQGRSCCGAAAVPTRGRPAVGAARAYKALCRRRGGAGRSISPRTIAQSASYTTNAHRGIQDLVNNVYPDIHNISCKTISWFKERAILSPTNEQVDKVNNLILAKIDTPTQIYYSVDTVLGSEEAVHFPTEFLNSLNPSGLPNLNPPKLCNGTRLLVKSLKTFIIECTILTGCGTGEDVLIPRIPLIPSDLPFQFKRLQFPVKISFAMTINKSQGQTFNVAGLDLSVECFSHGQLYVALSRVTSKQNMFVLSNDKKAVNVVYKDIL
ncbi:hypothetical protein ABMA28_006552 [Loxostege sticticalis]|uniref:ATP-dependent DNA helicase n=1 Tax=Loxostege sticticalis TaxID=481309 RepID=A0ABD0SLK8_LOXSC